MKKYLLLIVITLSNLDICVYAQKKEKDLGIWMVIVMEGTTPVNTLNANSKYTLGFSVKNLGDSLLMNLSAPETLWFEYTIAGGASKKVGWIYDFGVEWWTPGDFSFTITDDFTVPDMYGNIQVCVKTLYPGDMDNSNDKFCNTFKAVGGSVPAGIKTQHPGIVNSYLYKNGYIYLQLMDNPNWQYMQMDIINITGQIVKKSRQTNRQHSQFFNTQINMNDLAQGMYVLVIQIDNQKREHYKITIY